MSPSTLRVESSLAIALASAILAVVDSSAAGQAQPAAPQAAARVDVFLGALQRAVEGRDRRAVASMVQYPINVLVSGLQVPIRDAATMVKTYDAVFTPDLENMIAQSGVPRTGQPAPPYPIRTTPDGMVLGGFVWIQRVGSGFKIVRITVPPTASVRALRHEPTRVTFPNGVTAQLSGLLVRRDEYRHTCCVRNRASRFKSASPAFAAVTRSCGSSTIRNVPWTVAPAGTDRGPHSCPPRPITASMSCAPRRMPILRSSTCCQ